MSANPTARRKPQGAPAPPPPASGARSMAVDHVAEMLACVRASGLKLTPQRMAIVRELAADPTHPTAQELFERLRPGLPTMSFATVYNTLDALAAAGLCASLSLSPGPARFDPNMAAHHHAVCDRCGLVRDIPCDEGDPDPAQPEGAPARQPPGFQIRAVELTYRGLCAACATLAPEAPARTRRGVTSGDGVTMGDPQRVPPNPPVTGGKASRAQAQSDPTAGGAGR